jgi:N-acetylated-alpha-linked acidic dipeptidase
MRLADADLLPFDFNNFADTVQTYAKELKTLAQKMRDDITERNRQIDEGVFTATNDPKKPLIAPPTEVVPPYLNFAPFDNAVDQLNHSAADYKKALDHANADGGSGLASASLAEVNRLLIESEHKLTTPEGLPNRPWYKHQLYAPGFYTGYAVKTVPAVREAIELKQWKQADDAIVVVAGVLQDEAALISSAATKLAAATQH